jgi:hypothetical protein
MERVDGRSSLSAEEPREGDVGHGDTCWEGGILKRKKDQFKCYDQVTWRLRAVDSEGNHLYLEPK